MVTEETNKHFFLHCKYTAQLWNLFLNITGYSWAIIHQAFLAAGQKRGKYEPNELVEIDSLMYMVVSMEGEK